MQSTLGRNLDLLRVFHYVARLGSMTASAEALSVTQPAVSHAIALLEDRMETKLFARSGRKLALTAEGRALFQATREIAAALERGQTELDALRAMQSGTIEFMAPFLLLHTFLLPYVADFHQKFPRIRFRIHIENRREQLIRAAADASYDFVCMATPTMGGFPESVTLDPVASYRLCLMANRSMYGELEGRALTLEQVNQHPLIILTRGNSTRDVFDEVFRSIGLDANVAFEGETMAVVEDFTVAGLGLGVLLRREPAREGEFPAGLFEVKTTRPLPKGNYVIARRAGQALPDPAAALISGISRRESVWGSGAPSKSRLQSLNFAIGATGPGSHVGGRRASKRDLGQREQSF